MYYRERNIIRAHNRVHPINVGIIGMLTGMGDTPCNPKRSPVPGLGWMTVDVMWKEPLSKGSAGQCLHYDLLQT